MYTVHRAAGNLVLRNIPRAVSYTHLEGENRDGLVVIDAASKAQIRGIDAGTYQVIEERAADGYQLLKQPVILTLTSESGREAFPMAYIAKEEGAYFQIEEGKGYYVEPVSYTHLDVYKRQRIRPAAKTGGGGSVRVGHTRTAVPTV